MITRKHLRLTTAVIYSWRIILFSFLCSLAAFLIYVVLGFRDFVIPISVVAVMGTALAIILGFRNASAYDRWWEARKLWGGIVNESRTLTRQVITIVDPEKVPKELWDYSTEVVRRQIAWANALKLQLRDKTDTKLWEEQVKIHIPDEEFKQIMQQGNKATQLMMLQGRAVKRINSKEMLDIYSYIQMDDTLTRLTDLQGGCERIKVTPLPRPYDYYTLSFLYCFVTFLPFGFLQEFTALSNPLLLFPVVIIVSWIFYQIYVLGMVLACPFNNLATDIPLDAICTVIEIDLKEVIGDTDIPEKLQPVNGVIM